MSSTNAIHEKSINVFISYSHDSEEHVKKVEELAQRLIIEGISCDIDQYNLSPDRGWPAWMEENIRLSDYVLVVCTEVYLRRCEGREETGKGLGAIFESILLIERLYDNAFVNKKVIPVIFHEDDVKNIPLPLKTFTWYNAVNETGYKSLYRRLTGQIEIVKPPLGKIVILPSAVNLNKPEIRTIKKDHKSKLIIIEDDTELAEDFVQHLKISHLVQDTLHITDINALSMLVTEDNPFWIFWVDISLGDGRDDDGLEMIKIIKQHSPSSLIIVYSAYPDARQKCMAMGVEYFFLKSRLYEETIGEIRKKIGSFLLTDSRSED